MIIFMKKILAICICAVILSGCVSCGSVLSSSSPSPSSNPLNSPVTTDSPSNFASTSPISEAKSLLFAEDDHTKAIFHIGMTADQAKQTLTENQMQTVQNEYPNPNRISTDHGIDLLFALGTDLFDMISIESDSDTQLHSPYETQKGLKIGDAVETVRKLYGKPVEQVKYGDDINGLGVAYYYDIPINLDDYYKKQTVKNKSDRGVYLRINISQSKGNNFNKVVTIIYAEKANN